MVFYALRNGELRQRGTTSESVIGDYVRDGVRRSGNAELSSCSEVLHQIQRRYAIFREVQIAAILTSVKSKPLFFIGVLVDCVKAGKVREQQGCGGTGSDDFDCAAIVKCVAGASSACN